MGRGSASYKGHYRTAHGGAIGGIYSTITMLPGDSLGVIVFSNGAQAGGLPGIIANTIVDRLLGLGDTPWSDRSLKDYLKNKATDREARKKPDVDRVANTKPSHPLADYAGFYDDPAYGIMEITYRSGKLGFNFHNTSLPLEHYHYDRFVSPDDEIDGKWSLLFSADAQGSVQQVKVSLDEKEVTFTRKADSRLSDPNFLKNLTGHYELNGITFNVSIIKKDLILTTSPPQHLDPYKGNVFRIREFSDQLIEFVLDGSVMATSLKLTADGKTVVFLRKK